MKYFMVVLLILAFSTSYAYDGTVKDKQGRVVNYIQIKGDTTYILDKQGRREYIIKSDGKVTDPQGRTLYKVKMK